MASLLAEIPPEALTSVTGGRIRAASAGKLTGRHEQILAMMTELKSTLDGLRASRGNSLAMMLPFMIAMRGGNPEMAQAMAKAMSPAAPEAPKETKPA